MSLIASDIVLAYKRGLKTVYYSNIKDSQDEDVEDGCGSGACTL